VNHQACENVRYPEISDILDQGHREMSDILIHENWEMSRYPE